MDFGGAKNENLEVTGVSRSGRVRKKSSKLLDFESTDEVEGKHRKKSFPVADTPQRVEKPVKPKTAKSPKPQRNDDMEPEDRIMYDQYGGNPANSSGDHRQSFNKKDHDDDDDSSEDEEYTAETDDGGDEDMEDDDELEGNLVVDEKTHPTHPTQSTQSLYMSEKSRKRSVIKDGKLVPHQRTSRKDKGKTRFTAYMMWAKEVRQALNKQFPDMDFSTMARRLSEMWATVPNSEREHWKRRAKRESLRKAKAKQDAPLMPSRKFINKKGGPIAPLMNSQASQAHKPAHHLIESPLKHVVRKVADVPAVAPVVSTPVAPAAVAVPSSPQYKVTGIAPIDIAAHLKLLGESLSVIGERLQEHEGQIAVSGSLSVLLDSLLCSMGSLVCLTQQVADLQPATDPETLAKILNNIAYTMPGLG